MEDYTFSLEEDKEIISISFIDGGILVTAVSEDPEDPENPANAEYQYKVYRDGEVWECHRGYGKGCIWTDWEKW